MNPPVPPLDALLEHQDFVHDLAHRLLRDDDAATDVVQETWLAAAHARPDASRSLRPWLARVARRLALVERRRNVARRGRERAVARRDEVPSSEEIVAREERRQALVGAVLRLTPPSREVVLLRYFENLPPREIARHLGVSVETVKSRLQRGLEDLRGQLRREWGGEYRGLALLALAGRSPVHANPVWKLAMVKTQKNLVVAAVSVLVLILAGVGGLQLLDRDGTRVQASPEPEDASVSESETSTTPDELSGEDRTGLVAAASAGGPALLGRVVVRGEGTPVWAVDVNWEWASGRAAGSRTDDEGRFELTLDARDTLSRISIGVGDATIPLVVEPNLALAPGEGRELTLEVSRGTRVLGRVVDGEGRAVPGARVHGWCAEERIGLPHRSAVADGDGAFALPSLGREVYLEATAPDVEPARVVTGRLPDVPEASGFVLRVARGRVMRGRTLSAEGTALAGVRVHVPRRDPSGGSLTPTPGAYYSFPASAVATSASDGFFTLSHHHGPRPELEATHPGYQRWRGQAAEEGEWTDIVLAPSLELTGRVLTEHGSPISGASVSLSTRKVLASATSDAEGHFVLRGLEPVPYCWLGVHARGYAIEAIEHLQVPRPTETPLEVRLSTGRSIAGVVRWVDGSPADGVRLRLDGDRRLARDYQSGVDHPNTLEWRLLAPAEKTADDGGRFAFDDLYGGSFEVEVAYGEDPERRQWWTLESGTEDVELVLDPAVEQGTRFEGIVVDAVTREPVRDFRAQVIGVRKGIEFNSPPIRFTSPDGRFRLPAEAPAEMRVFVTAEGYVRGASAYEAFPPGLQRVEIELAPTRTLVIRLVESDGSPISGASVLVSREDGNHHWVPISRGAMGGSLRTNAEGEAILHGLPTERVGIWAGTGGEERRSWTFEVDLTGPIEGVHELRAEDDGE